MRSSTRSAHVPAGPNRKAEDRSRGSEQQVKHRMRILLCACNANDAQRALKYGHRMEIAFLPSYDLEEIRREIRDSSQSWLLAAQMSSSAPLLLSHRVSRHATNKATSTLLENSRPHLSLLERRRFWRC